MSKHKPDSGNRVGVQKGIKSENIVAAFDAQGVNKNIAELARMFKCSTTTIYYHLTKEGAING